MEQSATMTCAHHEPDADGYDAFEALIRDRVAEQTGPLFETSASGLFDLFLANLPAERRQHYTCHACRRFFDSYGHLVTIEEDGAARSFLWALAGVPAFFASAVDALWREVTQSRVTGVFLNSAKVWGTPRTGEWTHLSGIPAHVFSHALKTAAQMMAEKREDYAILRRGLAEYPLAVAEQTVTVLEADALDRSEKTLGVACWLRDLHQAMGNVKGPRRDNIAWRAVATAPPGFCHIRSTMISTLLDDLVAGLPMDAIRKRWADKMHPLQYQRPTVVKDGTIKRAEEIVARLQSAGALERRFARLSEVAAFWRPTRQPLALTTGSGVFGHLKSAQPARSLELPAQTMTWEKFRRLVLPEALEIDLLTPSAPSHFYGMVTAVNPDAPPILQWDGLEDSPRNPFSWYVYHGGSHPGRWNLTAGQWCKVDALCLKPPHWHRPDLFSHQGEAVLVVLEGARDLTHEHGGGFFPEMLRSEYHEIRSVMEAYAQKAQIRDRQAGDANGLVLPKGSDRPWYCQVRVKSRASMAVYNLDRWD